MHRGIGLCGSHRTGKTTLAREISARSGKEFIQTSTSEVFADNALDPSAPMNFATRIWIQDKVVSAAEAIWAKASGPFITDRTPLDMIAYTMADIQGETDVDCGAFERYLDHCFAVTDRYFAELVVVQPGIPLVHEAGKAAMNSAYIEHLNTLILGLCADERHNCPVRVLRRNLLDLQQRVTEVIEGA